MEKLSFKFYSRPLDRLVVGVSVGVVNSGNLEILTEKHHQVNEIVITVTTTVIGFERVWQAVLADFVQKYPLGGLSLLINDAGATPAVVSLRLRQLYEKLNDSEESGANFKASSRYLELNARDRIHALVESNSFNEWLGPKERLCSPHLEQLDLPASYDDGVVIGSAKFAGQEIFIASQNYAFMGGAIGEVNGAKIAGICQKALKERPKAVILLLDSGGVRLQEANAGELAISEIIAAIMQLRFAGIPAFGVVAGRNGAFGGVGIISQCLDNIIVSENARTGVSGPEVIETVMGTGEYDSSDRALVWRTSGGRHRSIMGDGVYAKKDITAIQEKLILLINNYQPIKREDLVTENAMLLDRIQQFAQCSDGSEIWQCLGYSEPENIPNLLDDDFIKILK